jgi:DNA-binding NarL/FixJ family response regulator
MALSNDHLILRGKRVVLADYHPQSRTALREMVSLLGATSIINANNASEVVRLAKAGSIDMILCDYQLDGERDGQQLLEELRNTSKIPLATMFMMITGERTYQKVAAVAEFAPDDYLLKPFTANQLQARISAVAVKKKAFARAYTLMESGKLEAAIVEYGKVRETHPQYGSDALRLTIEVMLKLKRHADAQALLKEVIAQKLVPWAAMGLARIKYAEGALAEAETGLTGVVEDNPDYLGAKDLLAVVKEDLGKPDEALAVIEGAGAAGLSNIGRLRHAGNLAAQTGDHKKASAMLEKVVNRVRNSNLAKAEDFVALADAYMEQGRLSDAERVSTEQRRTMRDTPHSVLVSKLMEFQRCRRDPAAASQEKAGAALDEVLKARDELAAGTETLTAALEFDILNACVQAERFEPADAIGQVLLARPDTSARIIERIKALQPQFKMERARRAAIVPLDQVLAMLGRLMARGWDEAVGHACRSSLAHWAAKTPDDPRLVQARTRLIEVFRNFGFDTQGDLLQSKAA